MISWRNYHFTADFSFFVICYVQIWGNFCTEVFPWWIRTASWKIANSHNPFQQVCVVATITYKRRMILLSGTELFSKKKIQIYSQRILPFCQVKIDIWALAWENQQFAYAKTKTQISFAIKADQRLCIRYLDSTVPLLPKYKISSL